MGIADDILRRKLPTPKKKPEPKKLGDRVLGKSGHAEDVFLDTEPSIATRELPRFAADKVVHVDNLSEIPSAPFPPVVGAPGTAVPSEAIVVAGNKAGNVAELSIDPSGSVLTVDEAEGPTGNPAPINALQVGGLNQTSGNIEAIQIDNSGNLNVSTANGQILSVKQVADSVPQLTSAVVSFNATGDNTVIAGVALETIRVHRLMLTVSAPTNLTFKDSSPATFTGAMSFSAFGAFVLDFDGGEPWFKTAAAAGFIINQSGTAQVSGVIYFEQTP